MTAFFFSSLKYHIHLDASDSRREIVIAKEKVAFSLYYSNRILLSAKIPSFGRQDGYFFCILAYYRQIRRTFLACGVGWAYRLRPLVRIFHVTGAHDNGRATSESIGVLININLRLRRLNILGLLFILVLEFKPTLRG
ncbi:hypothetical protein GE21DRAFT_1223691 [Neurospora crassa]|nr:hypothetical protein GE21DRAFT_1223691 [Neurospora crassa]